MPRRTLAAELAGTIIAIERQVGDDVAIDDVILIMESMKMEIPMLAPKAGRIAEILVSDGDTVDEGQALVALDI